MSSHERNHIQLYTHFLFKESHHEFILIYLHQKKYIIFIFSFHFSSFLFLKVLFTSVHGGFYGIVSRIPSSRTNFTMLFHKLKRLDQAQCFVHRSAHWKVVDRDLAHNSFWVNDKETTKRYTDIFEEDTIVLGNSLRQIGE